MCWHELKSRQRLNLTLFSGQTNVIKQVGLYLPLKHFNGSAQFFSKWMPIEHNSHLVLTLSLYNFQHVVMLLLSMHMMGSPDVTLVWSPHLFGFGKLSRMLVKALAKHHLYRSRADSRGTLAHNYTGHNVLWNKMQRGDLFTCLQQLPTIAFPDRLTYVETRPTHDNLPHIGCALCFEMFIQTSFQRTGNIK